MGRERLYIYIYTIVARSFLIRVCARMGVLVLIARYGFWRVGSRASGGLRFARTAPLPAAAAHSSSRAATLGGGPLPLPTSSSLARSLLAAWPSVSFGRSRADSPAKISPYYICVLLSLTLSARDTHHFVSLPWELGRAGLQLTLSSGRTCPNKTAYYIRQCALSKSPLIVKSSHRRTMRVQILYNYYSLEEKR